MDPRLTLSDFLLPIAVCVSAGMIGAAGYFIAMKALGALGVLPTDKEDRRGEDGTKFIGGNQ
jgi:ABC-type transport system involved in cytochrome bd biosynthesis fused ATPase/permease subunit